MNNYYHYLYIYNYSDLLALYILLQLIQYVYVKPVKGHFDLIPSLCPDIEHFINIHNFFILNSFQNIPGDF